MTHSNYQSIWLTFSSNSCQDRSHGCHWNKFYSCPLPYFNGFSFHKSFLYWRVWSDGIVHMIICVTLSQHFIRGATSSLLLHCVSIVTMPLGADSLKGEDSLNGQLLDSFHNVLTCVYIIISIRYRVIRESERVWTMKGNRTTDLLIITRRWYWLGNIANYLRLMTSQILLWRQHVWDFNLPIIIIISGRSSKYCLGTVPSICKHK
jgi:hypothetical protein